MAAVARDRLEVVALRLGKGALGRRHGQEQVAESDHAVEGRAQLVRHVREELVLELSRLVERGVEAGQLLVLRLQLGVLRLQPLRCAAHFYSQATGVLMGRFALAGDGQVGRGVLERYACVGGQLPRHGRDQQPHQPTLGAQGRKRQPSAGIAVRGGEVQLRPHGSGCGACMVDDGDRVTHQLAHDVARQGSRRGAVYGRRPPFVGVVLRLIERQRRRFGSARDHVERGTEAAPRRSPRAAARSAPSAGARPGPASARARRAPPPSDSRRTRSCRTLRAGSHRAVRGSGPPPLAGARPRRGRTGSRGGGGLYHRPTPSATEHDHEDDGSSATAA